MRKEDDLENDAEVLDEAGPEDCLLDIGPRDDVGLDGGSETDAAA